MRATFPQRIHGAFALAGLCLLMAAAALGQAPAPGPRAAAPLLPFTGGTPLIPPAATAPGAPLVEAKPETKLAYVLGPDDQVSVTVLDVPEIGDRVYRIDLNGFIKLPMVTGRIQAAGLTVDQLEDEIAGCFKTILKDPQVTVSIDVTGLTIAPGETYAFGVYDPDNTELALNATLCNGNGNYPGQPPCVSDGIVVIQAGAVTGAYNYKYSSTSADVNVELSGTATPEPTTWVLLGVGIGILGLVRRRRN